MNTLVEELKAYVKDKPNITFIYGRVDFANLARYIDEGNLHLFLLSQEVNYRTGTFGVDEVEYVGTLLYVLKGNIAVDWQKKYDDNIARIHKENRKLVDHFNGCTGFRASDWRTLEVINEMDEGMDGLMITATLLTHA